MELRKDPITRSWVIVGHREDTCETSGGCPFCPAKIDSKAALLRLPPQGPRQVTVLPHPDPLYRVEGDPARRADGIYDAMQPVGADEIVIETPEHDRKLEDLSDDQILLVMEAWRQRIEDLSETAGSNMSPSTRIMDPWPVRKVRTRIRKSPRRRLCPGESFMNCEPRGNGTRKRSAAFFATS